MAFWKKTEKGISFCPENRIWKEIPLRYYPKNYEYCLPIEDYNWCPKRIRF